MRVAIIGASGKMGTQLVSESFQRGHQVVAVCRDSSVHKLDAFAGRTGFTVAAAPLVSDEAMLTQALEGCDAVAAILITVRDLKATELVTSLTKAAAANEVKRLVFTAGEVTAMPEEGETFTPRQRFLYALGRVISWISPYSITDMVKASVLVREQADWEWTVVRAPALREAPASGYRFCEVSEITSKHFLSRKDYAACLIDSMRRPDHHRRMLTVVSANDV
jgi:putative NADH-flavin reductase